MNQPTTLDLTGGWENIVNNVERHNARARREAKREARRTDKMKQVIINLSLGAVLVVALAFAGLVAPWVAGGIAVVLVCMASAIAGRVWERRR